MNNLQILICTMISLVIITSSCEGDQPTTNLTPGETIEKYYELVLAEKYNEAAEMFSNKSKTLSIVELDKMEELINWSAAGFNGKGGIKEVIIIEETIIGDHKSSKVKYNIVFVNNDEDDKTQALEKIEGKWFLKTTTQ